MTALVHRASRRVSLAELLHKVRGPSERDMAAALEAAAAKLEPVLRDAFLAAAQALGNAVDLERLVAFLEAGRVGDAVVVMDRALSSPNAWDPFKAGVVQAVQQAADAAARLQPAIPFGPDGLGALEVRFNVLNPRTAEYLRRYAADLATELSDGARRAVNQAARVIIREGVVAGQGARDTASQLRAAIGLNAQQEAAARNYEAALRAGDMATASQYKLRDKRFSHDRAPDTDEKIQRMVEGYRKKALAYRALVISRTESIRALHVGQHQLWEQQVQEGRVRLEDLRRKWIYSADSKVRHAHKTIPKRNPDGRGLREPFDTELGPLMFPGDPAGKAANVINCRCTVITRLDPRAFAAAEVQPPKPVPKPAKPPAPKPPPDPLGLAAKAPMETAWHSASWDAPKVLQDAIRLAPQTHVFHSSKWPFQTTSKAWVPPAEVQPGRESWINMGDSKKFRVDDATSRAMFRHEYGHHLDTTRGPDRRAHSFQATAEVKADSAALIKRLKAEDPAKLDAEMRRRRAPAEAVAREVFATFEGQPGEVANAADRAETQALLEAARAALLEAKVDAPVEAFGQPAAEDESPMETVFREQGAARRALSLAVAIITESPRAIAQAAGRDRWLMDFVGAITKEGKAAQGFGYGHKPAYYAKFNAIQANGVNVGQTMEAFANYVSALGDGTSAKSVVALAAFRALAPKTTLVFDRILDELATRNAP